MLIREGVAMRPFISTSRWPIQCLFGGTVISGYVSEAREISRESSLHPNS